MVISVLDASAILRFLLGQAGRERIIAVLEGTQLGQSRSVISSVNWGEVVSKIYKAQGRPSADALTSTMQFYGLEIIPMDAQRATRAAVLKVDLKLGYADAICVELALSLPGSLLLTADYDFEVASTLVRTEFLPNYPAHLQ